MNQKEILKTIETSASKSKAMIALYNNGLEIKEIANQLNVRYNFVYNVISNMCRINDVELRTNKDKEDSKKSLIIKLLNEGKSNTEIAKELKTNYNYVYKITKEELTKR